jgi:hypothetical protein
MPKTPRKAAYIGDGDGRPNPGDGTRPSINPGNRGKAGMKSTTSPFGMADARPYPKDNALGANRQVPVSSHRRSSTTTSRY